MTTVEKLRVIQETLDRLEYPATEDNGSEVNGYCVICGHGDYQVHPHANDCALARAKELLETLVAEFAAK